MKEVNMLNEIAKASSYGSWEFLQFIGRHNLLKDFIEDINVYLELPVETAFDKLAVIVVRQLDKDQYNRWVGNIKLRAKENNSSTFEYYLAFCMSSRSKLLEALYAIWC